MAGLTLLRVVSGDDLAKQERAQLQSEMEARQQNPVILGLAAHLRTCWDAARMAKDPINDIMLKA